ncbi:MAG: hypothetical protein JWP69_1682 [Flaviaesturariibacter sp.]|nr:hypothetical protein [Flaviaesturariibacter sp.]
MTTTALKYSPSINIVRDRAYAFSYIPTPNTEQLFTQLIKDITAGTKAQLLIGAYGTGKSSFLLAFKQQLTGIYKHFPETKALKMNLTYEFISLVGDNNSLFAQCAAIFKVDKEDYSTLDVIEAIDKRYKQLQKKGLGLAFLIDEFGKYLEYAAKTEPGIELYFIQQLCEWINDTTTQALFIGVLHQDFNAYALGLTKSQQQEWSKVKGRFKEIVFNEPVEQLLLLASKRIGLSFKSLAQPKTFDRLFRKIKESKSFPLRDYLDTDFAKQLYPFDILSGAILTLALQRYGQNERSLFSFIESNDHLSINEFDTAKYPYYSIDRVYDYLINNFYSVITHKSARTNSVQWQGIRKGLERVEGVIAAEHQQSAQQLIKTIGLLNIFSSAAAQLDQSFYTDYGKYAMGLKDPEKVLDQLVKFKIIRFVKHSFKYVIFEGTDLDIDLAIDQAGEVIEKVTNLVEQLNQFFDFPFVAAKSISFEKGTPRFFQFKLSEDPIVLAPEGEIDGFINLIFNDHESIIQSIEETSRNAKEPILYGYYKNTQLIQDKLFDIQKVRKVIAANMDDTTAIKYLKEEEAAHIRLLNHYVLDSLYSENGNITWYYQGNMLSFGNRQSFNRQLSVICRDYYGGTPTVRNELFNKTKPSTQVSNARRELVNRLLNNIDKENIGFDKEKFPPEKSIYLSLVKETGIHAEVEGVWSWKRPTDQTFNRLWTACEEFLDTTKGKDRSLQEFTDLLLAKPFKLKQGFIDYWVPVFLLAKADEYALFDANGFIPALTTQVLDLVNKKPSLFRIKAFDVEGIKLELFNRYRVFLSQAEHSKPNNKVFIQSVRPFMALYKELNEYARTTANLSRKAIAFREVIAKAKDPEKALFEDFPTALGISVVEIQQKPEKAETFIKLLQGVIRELRSVFEKLAKEVEQFIIAEMGTVEGFPAYKTAIEMRYSHLRRHLLTAELKTFYGRLISPMEDRISWLSSVCQACIGKPLEKITDDDKFILLDKLRTNFYALDNLSEISKADINEESEEVLKFELTSFVEGINKSLLRIPKNKTKEVLDKQSEIKSLLGGDKKVNIAILATLIKEYLTNE